MYQLLIKPRQLDFEQLGLRTMMECGDLEQAKNICGQHLQVFAHDFQPEIVSLQANMAENNQRARALHAHLYDRPIPVNDAAMLAHSFHVRSLMIIAAITAIACLAGNFTTFFLLGWGNAEALLMALGVTGLLVGVGYLTYEKLIGGHNGLQIAVVVIATLLCLAATFQLADARRLMMDRAMTPDSTSYIEKGPTDDPVIPETNSPDGTESRIHGRFGQAMLLFTLAAELTLGYLVGLLMRKRADENYTAWRKLKEAAATSIAAQTTLAELLARIESAKSLCLSGILRAQAVLNKRRPPYYRALVIFIITLMGLSIQARAQRIDRYEGILIDTSGSIAKGSTQDDLFRAYLGATKNLLLTELPNSSVLVSTIATDSFGGVQELLKGWTPDSRGVFTDDLNHARRQLAADFQSHSSRLAPTAERTDIFGALWHLKAVFESRRQAYASQTQPKIIWIFSDMMNETQEFPMPSLLQESPEQILEEANKRKLVVPLVGYKIYIYGASTRGLTPQMWTAIKRFWAQYFHAAGAELMSYSTECDVRR